jgi:predicted DNA-binding transcriptional regulator AlpA
MSHEVIEPVAVDWDTAPDLWTLKEVVHVMRCSLSYAYTQCSRGQFPIAHLPNDGRSYRFPKANVLAWVAEGRATNPKHGVRRGLQARRRHTT